ncbi:hypothetical protein V8C86DRAFT_77547 [Haematococcus lacustris]
MEEQGRACAFLPAIPCLVWPLFRRLQEGHVGGIRPLSGNAIMWEVEGQVVQLRVACGVVSAHKLQALRPCVGQACWARYTGPGKGQEDWQGRRDFLWLAETLLWGSRSCCLTTDLATTGPAQMEALARDKGAVSLTSWTDCQGRRARLPLGGSETMTAHGHGDQTRLCLAVVICGRVARRLSSSSAIDRRRGGWEDVSALSWVRCGFLCGGDEVSVWLKS